MKKTLIDEDERQQFRTEVQNVTPLKKRNLSSAKKPRPRAALLRKNPPPLLEACPINSTEITSEVGSEEPLHFARSGVQPRIMQQLRRGHFPVDAELDLHGITMKQAHEILYQFLTAAMEQHWRVVRIIHGKGARTESKYPVLKNKVNEWLQGYENVLAFCSAKMTDGGTGAVYVLLKIIELDD